MNKVCCYWEGKAPPAYLSLCVSTWLDYLRLEDVVIINQSNVQRYIGDVLDVQSLKMYSFAKQSDIVSALYLNKFGGTFIDIDTIMMHKGAEGFLSVSSEDDKLKLFGNKKKGGMHIGALTTPAGGKLIDYWAEELIQKVPKWESDNSWAYVGNLIIEPYAKMEENRDYLHVIDVNKNYVTPELQGISGVDKSPREKYEEFWFSPMTQDREEYIDALSYVGGGTVSLHNSWTPGWYAELGVDEILARDCALSHLFRNKAKPEIVSHVEGLLKYGS